MRFSVRSRGRTLGGEIKGYPIEQIYKEIAFISYYFHWSQSEVMEMEHRDRRRWCEEITKINQKVNENAQAFTE